MKPNDINLIDPELVVRSKGPPHEYFNVLRRESPVHWNPPVPEYRPKMAPLEKGFWILSKHADVAEASRNIAVFSCYRGGVVVWDGNEQELLLMRSGIMGMDPPEHARYRKLVQAPFTPGAIAGMEEMIRRTAATIIDAVAVRGECEMMIDVASHLPVFTMCHMMGIPDADRQKIFDLSNKVADMEGVFGDPTAARMEIYTYARLLAEKKRQQPDDSMLSALVHGVIDGERLTDLEINQFFLTISLAGHETTRNTTLHFVRLMDEYPEQRALLMTDLDKYLPNAIEEVLRFSPPLLNFRRTLTQNLELRGMSIMEGDKAYLSYPSANRDEDVFPDPHRFDITRENSKKHLSFGIGPHVCMGQMLARLQLRTILREIFTRLPDVHLAQPPELLPSLWFNGIVRMPVVFTPERPLA